MTDGGRLIYVLDSSALIAMQNELWPVYHFPPVWRKLDDLADAGRVLVCEAVKEECKDDELRGWFAKHPHMIVGPSTEMEFSMKRVMKDLQSKAKKLVDYETGKSGADPFVVACAMAHNVKEGGHFCSGRFVVVHHEASAANSPRKVNIGDVCAWYGITCLKALDILEKENWVF